MEGNFIENLDFGADDNRLKLFLDMQLLEVLEGKNRFSSGYENQVGMHNYHIIDVMNGTF